MRRLLPLFFVILLLFCGCSTEKDSQKAAFCAGFGCVDLPIPENSDAPLYIAGYHSGWEIAGVLDVQQARALWLEDGSTRLLLIVVDCIGLGRDTVQAIRHRLKDFSKETGCDAIHVIATHTHAGVDTLGLWGPMAMDGKNAAFMETVIGGAAEAAQLAYSDRSSGSLYYSSIATEGLQLDSRNPQVFDENVYQLRFVPDDGAQNGIRLFSFGAHAESLRGENRLVSRDYPGVVCDLLKAETGDDALFLPGAVGGLIMTPELTAGDFDGKENMHLTGQMLAQHLLNADKEERITDGMHLSNVTFEVELDNTLFIYYKFLGILGNPCRQNLLGQYFLETELTVLQMGDLALALLPGEIFPELVAGPVNAEDPQPLAQIAAQYGIETLMVVGLADDELGYIVTPGDFVLDDDLPYVQEAEGDHYEETNSVGRDCAFAVEEAFRKALRKLQK